MPKLFGKKKEVTAPVAGQGTRTAGNPAPAAGNQAMLGGLGMDTAGQNVNALGDALRTRSFADMQRSNDASERMEGYAVQLGSSKKKGWKKQNSDSYEAVISKLNATMLTISSTNIPTNNPGAAATVIMKSVKEYSELVSACDQYISTHKKPRSDEGKNRKDAMIRIREQAQKDMQGMRDYYDVMPTLEENKRCGTLKEVLGQSRRRVLQLKDKKESQLKHVGGAASYIGVVDKGMLTGDNADASGFFKEDEVYNNVGHKANALAALKTAIKRVAPDVSDVESTDAYKALYAAISALKDTATTDDVKGSCTKVATSSSDPQVIAAANAMKSIAHASGNHYDHLVDKGSTGKTGKDVAGGVAAILKSNKVDNETSGGITQKIQSKAPAYKNVKELFQKEFFNDKRYKNDEEYKRAVDIAYQETNKKGALENANQQAGGTGNSINVSGRNVASSRLAQMLGIGDLVAQSETAELVDADGTSRTGNFMQKASGIEVRKQMMNLYKDEFYEKYRKEKKSHHELSDFSDKITPKFMRDLSSLQVFDTLSGQMDRHSNNYFATTNNEGKLDKVTGIDNDYSFTNTSIQGDKGLIGGSHGLSFATDGKMTMPYMDAGLASKIESLDPAEVRLMLEDVLEPWAIDSLIMRIDQAKEIIKEARQDNKKNRFLENESDWNKDVFNEFANTNNKDGYATTYLGRLNEGVATYGVASHNATQKALAEKYRRQLKKGKISE